MGGAGIIVGIFVALSMMISWVSGDRENEKLQDTIVETTFEKRGVESRLKRARIDFAENKENLKVTEESLRREKDARRKIQRALTFEKRQRRIALRKGDAIDVDRARDDMRREVEVEVGREVVELTYRLDALAESKKRLEAEMRLQIEEEARSRAEEAWTQAELARVRAEETAIYNEELLDRLNEMERERKHQEYARDDLGRRLAQEQESRSYLEARLRDAESRSEQAGGAGGAREGVGTASGSGEAWEQTELARIRAEEVAIKNEELIDRIRQMESELEDASDALKEQEKDSEELAESLIEEQAESATLEARIEEVEEALEFANIENDALAEGDGLREEAEAEETVADPEEIAALERSRDSAISKLVDKEIEIQDLTTRFGDASEEAEAAKKSAEENASRTALLEEEIKISKKTEETLRREAGDVVQVLTSLEEQLYALRDAELLAERVDSLEGALSAILIEKKAVISEKEALEESTSAEIAALKAVSEELKLRNIELADSLQETQTSLARAEAAKEMARGLIARNAALEVKVKEAGLVNLQGKAADYVAQKLIERNTDLEMRLQETELLLAETEAARVQGVPFIERNRELASQLMDAEVSLATLRGSSVRAEALSERNVELEARLQEIEVVSARAEASSFMVEELSARNLELEDRLKREQMIKGGGDTTISELLLAREAVDLRLVEEQDKTLALEASLKEARDAKSAGEVAINDFMLVRQDLEERLREERAFREDYEARLVELEAQVSSGETAAQQSVEARLEAEAALAAEIEAASVLEAKLREYQAREDADGIRVEELQTAVKAATERAIELEAVRAGEGLTLEKAEPASVLEAKLREYQARENADGARIEELEAAVKAVTERTIELEAVRADEGLTLEKAELEAASVLEAKLREYQARENADGARIEELEAAVKAVTERAIELEIVRADEGLTLEKAEPASVLEAKLREYQVRENADGARIEELETAVKDATERLLIERRAKEEIEGEITRLAAELSAYREETGEGAPLAKLKKELADLKQKIKTKLVSGELRSEDVTELARVDDMLNFYIVKSGDSLWSISSKKDVYDDPYKWPLLYKYNAMKLGNPDNIDAGQVLVIYRDVTEIEMRDAARKARFRGDWKSWDEEQRRSWLDDWLR